MVAPFTAPRANTLRPAAHGDSASASDSDPVRVGRLIAVLILLQMAGSFAVNFSLEAPIVGAPGFLPSASGHASQIAVGAILGLLCEALWLAIAIAVFPVIDRHSRRLAVSLVALSAVVLAVAIGEAVCVMSMVSVSQTFARATAADRATLEAIRVVVASMRNWTHYLARILDGAMILSLYAALFRVALVPRMLAVGGLVAASLEIVGVGVTLFGGDVIFTMLAPVGVMQLVLVGWLIAKGRGRPHGSAATR